MKEEYTFFPKQKKLTLIQRINKYIKEKDPNSHDFRNFCHQKEIKEYLKTGKESRKNISLVMSYLSLFLDNAPPEGEKVEMERLIADQNDKLFSLITEMENTYSNIQSEYKTIAAYLILKSYQFGPNSLAPNCKSQIQKWSGILWEKRKN